MSRTNLSKITLKRIKLLIDRGLFKDRSDLLNKAVESLCRDQLEKDCESIVKPHSKKKTEKS